MKKDTPEILENTTKRKVYPDREPLPKKETKFMFFSAISSSLKIAIVFFMGVAIFLLFCIYIWFR